jgi:hypothetical protein
MKNATRMLILTLTMLPLLAAAQLKTSDKIVTQVPFEFVLGNKVIPAGQCIVQFATMDGKVLTIRNSDAAVSLFSTAMLDETRKPSGHYSLVFNKYGDRYFLSAMKLAGTRTIYRLPASKAEAELRAQNVPATEETLLASLK